ncbi:DUF6517 family protein [Natrialbaceae archaeon GCM10025810]|uniref:DUF6517 family protein n=1 Tax=Halovalidus salilacus TaxID=3075124 RepID=UPI00362452C8
MNRRSFVAALAVGSVGSLAGCSEFLAEATTFSASPATVSAEALESAGYEYEGTEELVESKEVAGREVEATNYISEFSRDIDLGPLEIDTGDAKAGVFAVVTTPKVSVAGKNFNPIGEMSNEEVVELVQDQYERLSVDGSSGEREVDAFGKPIDVETFEGEATLAGEQGVDVLIDVSKPDHDDDHLVLLGVYPDRVPEEADRIDTLIEGLEHGDDVDVDIDGADEDEEGEGNESDE